MNSSSGGSLACLLSELLRPISSSAARISQLPWGRLPLLRELIRFQSRNFILQLRSISSSESRVLIASAIAFQSRFQLYPLVSPTEWSRANPWHPQRELGSQCKWNANQASRSDHQLCKRWIGAELDLDLEFKLIFGLERASLALPLALTVCRNLSLNLVSLRSLEG